MVAASVTRILPRGSSLTTARRCRIYYRARMEDRKVLKVSLISLAAEWVSLVTETLAGKVLKDDTLLRAFKLLDTDMDGFILVNDLQNYAKLNADEVGGKC